MTNDEVRMTKEARMSKSESSVSGTRIRHSSFVIPSSFGFRDSSFTTRDSGFCNRA
jgi:hypothetical protein